MSSYTSSVKRYFGKSYPNRGSLKSIFFRSGDSERSAIVSALLPSLAGKRLCDVGCGDGVQIRRILSTGNIPSSLVLQDILSVAVRKAKENLAGSGCDLSELVGDAFVDGLDGPHNVVIAIGITDYYPDWNRILSVLLEGTSEVLIVDFPRKWKLRNMPRNIWLRLNGLQFKAISHSQLCTLMSQQGCSFKIARSTYSWFVRIDKVK